MNASPHEETNENPIQEASCPRRPEKERFREFAISRQRLIVEARVNLGFFWFDDRHLDWPLIYP
jgi:hypothetical protein